MCPSIDACYSWTLYENSGYKIIRYKADDPVILPDGRKVNYINAGGNDCPDIKGITYRLNGDFKEYQDKKTGKNEYTFSLKSYEELIPSQKEGVISYLQSLDGVGEKTAIDLFDYFSFSVFGIIEKNPERLSEVRGISHTKAMKISTSYSKRVSKKAFFQYLFNYNLSESMISKIMRSETTGDIDKIKEDPYLIIECGVPFYTADRIAKDENILENDERRISAAILEVLKQSEEGGFLFGSSKYPEFVYDRFLRRPIYRFLNSEETNVTGNTYLPYPILYLKVLLLLDYPISESSIKKTLSILKVRGKIHYIKGIDIDDTFVFLKETFDAEYSSASKIKSLLSSDVKSVDHLSERIAKAEGDQGLRLSIEQRNAVITSLSNPVSIITGGPGTGKSSILKIIVDVYKGTFPRNEIYLASPTGQAAKRMHDVTGLRAETIHSLLGIRPDCDYTPFFTLQDSLVVIDETSMIGTKLLSDLLLSIGKGTNLIFVGDPNQLPSVEVGNCLKEMISSGIIPVSRLTKTFRTKDGSLIAVNAARIKNKEISLDYSDEFQFIETSNDSETVDKIKEIYKSYVDEIGIDNVIVLSPFYKSTLTGVKSLNNLLRSTIRGDLSKTKSYTHLGVTYYEGDRIMYIHNQGNLTNGDIGYISKISYISGKPVVVIKINGSEEEISGDYLSYIRLSFSQTVHKSQGLEYKVVVIALSEAHSILLSNPLIYTAMTRSKLRCICIGSHAALDKAILTDATCERRSKFGNFLNNL